MFEKYIGTPVIIRSSESGVHYGYLTNVQDNGRAVRLANSRRLWEWKVAGTGISLSEVAITGIDHANSRITTTLPDIFIMGVCEIIPAHGMASATIEGAAVTEAR
jgi:hypothetical protein